MPETTPSCPLLNLQPLPQPADPVLREIARIQQENNRRIQEWAKAMCTYIDRVVAELGP